MKKIFFIFLSIIILLIKKIYTIHCGEEIIDHCIQCGTDENNETCIQCENNYFLFLFNYLCLPCDNLYYGDVACDGNCHRNGNIFSCDENGCKEGFYNINGVCFKCDQNSPNCVKCNYLPPEGYSPTDTNERIFKCTECISNEYAIINNACHKCNIGNCTKCIYIDNSTNSICIECKDNFYINSIGGCSEIYTKYSIGGYCIYSTDNPKDYDNIHCVAYERYTIANHTKFIECPSYCQKCYYNINTNKVECQECFHRYKLNLNGTCINCGFKCEFCNLNNNQSPICTQCESEYNINNGICFKCPDNCKYCRYENNSSKCTECNYYYGLNDLGECISCPENCYQCRIENNSPKCIVCNKNYKLNNISQCTLCPAYCLDCQQNPNGILLCSDCLNGYILSSTKQCLKCPDNCSKCKVNSNEQTECINCNIGFALKDGICIECSTIQEIGGSGCDRCRYNYNSARYECINCINNNNYAFIQNTYKCLLNSISTYKNIRGCLIANFNEEKNTYECITCKQEFIPILNDKSCKLPNEANLKEYCKEANNIGTEQNPKYSCLKCKSIENINLIKIIDFREVNDCYKRENELIRCLTGIKYENNTIQCTKCISEFLFTYSDVYNRDICDEKCKVGFFNKNGWCYKCDNIIQGNEGCLNEYGCEYLPQDDHFNCNKCKNGYFNYTYGQCFSCAIRDSPCIECHQDIVENKFICDKCMDGYIKNEYGKCELITCDEYPEITPGCVICSDKINEYKPLNKCQSCKYGFFKTKDESCAFCKNLNNGGYYCELCEYAKDENGTEINEIKCRSCWSPLNSHGKCYGSGDYIDYEIGLKCKEIDFILREDNSKQQLVCTECYDNYILVNGSCIYYDDYMHYKDYMYDEDYLHNIPNCIQTYDIEHEKINESQNSYEIKPKCKICRFEYFINDKGGCDFYSADNCSFSSIFSNKNSSRYSNCVSICKNYEKYVSIEYYYELDIENDKNIYKLDINDLMNSKINYTDNQDLMNIINKGYLCLSNSGEGGKISPQNLRKCKKAKYITNNDTYICIDCLDNYSLDNETNLCKQSIQVKMNIHPGIGGCQVIQNIGTYNNPIYSCIKCYNQNDLLITIENNAKFCESRNGELEGCIMAYADTSYLNNIYNCTECKNGYISYYNNFFEKRICQNIYMKPDKIKLLDNRKFSNDVEHVNTTNGKCKDKYFTPDGERCYACNNRTVGIVGCKGSCIFSEKKNITLRCEEGKCKTGFIEGIKGVCESCDKVNLGCIDCHYENNTYPQDYYGLKRKRRFVCEQCDKGYLISADGTCHHCSTLGFNNCKNCSNDSNNEIICVECDKGYFISNEGKCIQCYYNQVRGKNNRCIECNDIENGGIEGCQACSNINDQIICHRCDENYLLYKDKNICLKKSYNIGLSKIQLYCTQVTKNNLNQFICTQCQEKYVLLNEISYSICVRAEYFEYFFDFSYAISCEEFINIGTEQIPKYTCTRCREDYVGYDNYFKGYIKITNLTTNTSFCISESDYNYQFNNYIALENCSEATMIKEHEIMEFNYTKCKENNTLKFYEDINSSLCINTFYEEKEKECAIKYCRICEKDNNYYCKICLPSNYEVNPLTGGCVRKTDKVPAIDFKDIFRFELNRQKLIGGKILEGPFLSLRGLTNSQINTGHTFLVYLTFILQTNDTYRNLEEGIKVPTYCQIVESVDETDDEANIVDYDCIGNLVENYNLSKYQLQKIEESSRDNENLLGNSNLDELASETDLENINKKTKTNYDLEAFIKLTTFSLDEIKSITSTDYHFEFTLKGKLNRNLEVGTINAQIPLSQIKDKKVECKFNIKENNKAELSCDINLEEYKDYNKFSFKVTEIGSNENPI